jgi:uncharacterized integral membrane protein
MKILSGFLSTVILLIVLCFALVNRQSVSVSLWPVADVIQIPIYLLSVGTLLIGLFLGGLVIWFTMLGRHFEMRRLRKEVALLKEKIIAFQQNVIPPRRADTMSLTKSARRFWHPRP